MNGKIWLITGISSGLGQALAQAVMDAGDFVIGTFRKSEQTATFIKASKGKGFAYTLDIADSDGLHNTVQAIAHKFNTIDVLVNNAGVGFIGAIEEASTEEVRQVFEANFFAALQLTQLVLPIMRKHKKGHIVQISSHGGIKAFAGFGVYNASKFALEGFSEALAQEVLPLGINVSIVQPGPFRTNFAAHGLQEAKTIIADYDETAGAFRSKLKAVHGKQEGDPLKAAKAIIDMVHKGNSSLRLPLGKIALATIGSKLASVQADLEAGKDIAEATVFS